MHKLITLIGVGIIVLGACTQPTKPEGGTSPDPDMVCDLTITTTTKAGTVCDVIISAITSPPLP